MARNPRPIDPSEGPLQAFAVELRRLREAAGDPTYRTMSARAGFSATTLSEAAGGVRKPSLDVTLAFVGVCGGDSAEWRERWVGLDRALAAAGMTQGTAAEAEAEAENEADANSSESAAAPTSESESEPESETAPGTETEAAAADSDADPADADPAGVGPHRKRWRRAAGSGRLRVSQPAAALLGIAGLLGVAAAVVVPQLRTGHGSPAAVPRGSSSGSEACPSTDSGSAAFSGETYIQGTHEHSGARLDAPVIAMLPESCMLSFSGYCIGQDLRDQKSGSPDMRWFKLLDGSGVVASAVVHGNPPASLPPTDCSDDAPPPAVVHLRIAAAAGAQNTAVLSATGIDAPIIGYAAYYSEQQGAGAQAPGWHELALNDPSYLPSPKWNLTDVRAAISGLSGVPSGTVPVVAVACLGGGAPTQIADSAAVSPGHPAQTEPVQLTPQALATAEQAACQYPATD